MSNLSLARAEARNGNTVAAENYYQHADITPSMLSGSATELPPFAGRFVVAVNARQSVSGRLIADYEARPRFVSVYQVERTGPSHDVETAQGYCRPAQMPATAAIIMLTP